MTTQLYGKYFIPTTIPVVQKIFIIFVVV